MKKYEIKTTKDIIKVVTTENLQCFLKDFEAWLVINILAKNIGELTNSVDVETSGSFFWTDDGKNDIRINIQTKIKK